MKPIRTALFAPGNRPDRVAKALGLTADCVVIDLEDAVPLAEKDSTRVIVRELLDQHPGKRIYVRINALGTPYAQEDIAALGSKNLAGIMVPKVDSPADLVELNRRLTGLERGSGLPEGALEVISLCETARGLEEIYPLAQVKTQPGREMILAFGAADYTLDLGIALTREGRELDYPRTRLPLASRAAGLGPPLDSPWMVDLKDIEGLMDDARRAKAHGFQGKIVIHPNQIGPCHEVFTPTAGEISFSRAVIEAFEKAEQEGRAAIQLEGRFIDYPVVERARRIIDLAEAIEDK